jgi:16S rRNA G527 N7-methylase RsmG
MTESVRDRLLGLITKFREMTLDAETFCSQFEHAYNMELDKKTLSLVESRAFAELFEQVIWFSPFTEERAKVPNYRGEAEIRAAAERAAQQLRAESP